MARETRIADRLRLYGLDVVEVDEWKIRGSTTFAPRGVVLHHTAGASTGDIPSLDVLVRGRADLPGPLCHIGLARSGRCYVIAAGRANHAGTGGWRGLTGNTSVFGIEAENNGSQPWPARQLEVFPIAAAALLSLTPARDPELVCAHREWAPSRKPDPHGIDMGGFRRRVAQLVQLPYPPTPPQGGSVLEYVRRTGSRTGAVYAVVGDVLVHITAPEYDRLGRPPVIDVPPDDARYRRPKLIYFDPE